MNTVESTERIKSNYICLKENIVTEIQILTTLSSVLETEALRFRFHCPFCVILAVLAN